MTIARRLRPFGTSIFTEMSALALRTGALNLGQGFPDTDGPSVLMDAVDAAMRSGRANQYAPLAGMPELRLAIADHQRRRYGIDVDPDAGVQVTFGATEAIAAAMLGLLEPGDAVVVLEPFYDSYAAAIAMAGGARRLVTLRPPDFALDVEALGAAAPGARMLVLNSPHNPTGRVLTRSELEAIARICVEHDLVAVTDEVYEHLVYDGEHVPLATLDGMAERTLTISSAGKSFSFTGWKVGWACGPADLIAAVRTAKMYLSYSGATPFQHAATVALNLPPSYVEGLAAGLAERRDLLSQGLRDAGLTTFASEGTYFVTTDAASVGAPDGVEFCLGLPERVGVVAVPMSVFYDDADAGRTLVRFAFCKRPELLAEAAARLKGLRSPA